MPYILGAGALALLVWLLARDGPSALFQPGHWYILTYSAPNTPAGDDLLANMATTIAVAGFPLVASSTQTVSQDRLSVDVKTIAKYAGPPMPKRILGVTSIDEVNVPPSIDVGVTKANPLVYGKVTPAAAKVSGDDEGEGWSVESGGYYRAVLFAPQSLRAADIKGILPPGWNIGSMRASPENDPTGMNVPRRVAWEIFGMWTGLPSTLFPVVLNLAGGAGSLEYVTIEIAGSEAA